MATLHLMVGLPCSGKTTLAKQLETDLGALRLTPDEWHRFLFGQDAINPDHDERHQKIETLQWNIAATALEHGLDVITDYGLWTKNERQDYRQRASALNAGSIIYYLDVPIEQLFARLEVRNQQSEDDVTFIPPSEMQGNLTRFEAPDAEEMALNAD